MEDGRKSQELGKNGRCQRNEKIRGEDRPDWDTLVRIGLKGKLSKKILDGMVVIHLRIDVSLNPIFIMLC